MGFDLDRIRLGIMGDIDGWIDFNRHAAFD